mmetsp:Transcript_7782/g.16731  ORF Transcript_7782/g.16731 Transcript_7782/m.16731 type:complete len:246 (-) Transcript_7782:309-1046(-)
MPLDGFCRRNGGIQRGGRRLRDQFFGRLGRIDDKGIGSVARTMSFGEHGGSHPKGRPPIYQNCQNRPVPDTRSQQRIFEHAAVDEKQGNGTRRRRPKRSNVGFHKHGGRRVVSGRGGVRDGLRGCRGPEIYGHRSGPPGSSAGIPGGGGQFPGQRFSGGSRDPFRTQHRRVGIRWIERNQATTTCIHDAGNAHARYRKPPNSVHVHPRGSRGTGLKSGLVTISLLLHLSVWMIRAVIAMRKLVRM